MKLIETENEWVLEGECKCESCDGAGLYTGMAERAGAAVVCRRCKGTGKIKVRTTYEKFTEKKIRTDIKRVFSDGMGYCIVPHDITRESGEVIHFSKFGCSYGEWLSGATPIPIKELGCPYQHTNQRLQSEDVNDLYKNKCSKLNCGMRISDCENYDQKQLCWDIYEGKQTLF